MWNLIVVHRNLCHTICEFVSLLGYIYLPTHYLISDFDFNLVFVSATFDNLTLVRLQFFVALTSVATCFYLAYLLIFVLKDFCVVCVSTYVFNGAIVYLLHKKMQILKEKAK